jgi:hypothetical protein
MASIKEHRNGIMHTHTYYSCNWVNALVDLREKGGKTATTIQVVIAKGRK